MLRRAREPGKLTGGAAASISRNFTKEYPEGVNEQNPHLLPEFTRHTPCCDQPSWTGCSRRVDVTRKRKAKGKPSGQNRWAWGETGTGSVSLLVTESPHVRCLGCVACWPHCLSRPGQALLWIWITWIQMVGGGDSGSTSPVQPEHEFWQMNLNFPFPLEWGVPKVDT